jgi:DNA-binding transcriptional ArsR family regulator
MARNDERGDVFKALADPSRRLILRLTAEHTMSVGEIAEHFDFTKPSLSRHLKILREAELVVTKRVGTRIEYSANLTVLQDALARLMGGLGIGEKNE